ncbi:glycine cleavage system aminomethyltransferase GcvT [Isachenkonia alkalipeptolytica]|uniref:Aminomethyltransferase n=1 Tax=Isachenkonia alkalipeptolytica TaxID=2565777 RepID=A0AA43XKN6_9CLOT|nr:glycine cleavage system aminomethyltransferase GcvT [Isachenkonia alkalipeptolytica]NBG88039.1 glycine cleavage system aminomethyltransferase GcvT [Isachenkonia alkalipeptolytica]
MENVKKTPLYEEHLNLEGKVVDFHGWALPIEYEGILQEHQAVRERAGLFDVSHMGELRIKGDQAEAFVQYLMTNDITTMDDGQIVYTFMCYPHGGVVDDLLVYKYDRKHYYLVINASNVDKDFQWIRDQKKDFKVEVQNESDEVAEVAIQGPKAEEILQKLTDTPLKEITFFTFKEGVKISGKDCLVSRTGYTGEDGFEVYMKPEDAREIWRDILRVGKEEGIQPAALGARDTLRFEAGLPLYGNELSKDITPLEAGFGFFVKFTEDDFIGKEALQKHKKEGVQRKIVGFELMKKGIPREGYEVYKEGQKIGVVTTGYLSPTLGKSIGLALVDVEHGKMGKTIQIKVRKREIDAQIISKRFLK